MFIGHLSAHGIKSDLAYWLRDLDPGAPFTWSHILRLPCSKRGDEKKGLMLSACGICGDALGRFRVDSEMLMCLLITFDHCQLQYSVLKHCANRYSYFAGISCTGIRYQVKVAKPKCHEKKKDLQSVCLQYVYILFSYGSALKTPELLKKGHTQKMHSLVTSSDRSEMYKEIRYRIRFTTFPCHTFTTGGDGSVENMENAGAGSSSPLYSDRPFTRAQLLDKRALRSLRLFVISAI